MTIVAELTFNYTSFLWIAFNLTRQFSPNGILQFFNYEIQVVPAVVSEQAWIKTEGYGRDFRVAVVKREILRVS